MKVLLEHLEQRMLLSAAVGMTTADVETIDRPGICKTIPLWLENHPSGGELIADPLSAGTTVSTGESQLLSANDSEMVSDVYLPPVDNQLINDFFNPPDLPRENYDILKNVFKGIDPPSNPTEILDQTPIPAPVFEPATGSRAVFVAGDHTYHEVLRISNLLPGINMDRLLAFVDWGDGSPVTPILVYNGNQDITPTDTASVGWWHIYQTVGQYDIKITFPKECFPYWLNNTYNAFADKEFHVTADVQSVSADGRFIKATAGEEFTTEVALAGRDSAFKDFTTADGPITARAYVNWGDSDSFEACPSQVDASTDLWSVIGTHTYAQTGEYRIKVFVTVSYGPTIRDGVLGNNGRGSYFTDCFIFFSLATVTQPGEVTAPLPKSPNAPVTDINLNVPAQTPQDIEFSINITELPTNDGSTFDTLYFMTPTMDKVAPGKVGIGGVKGMQLKGLNGRMQTIGMTALPK